MIHGRHLDQLGTEQLSWRELQIILMHCPPEQSALRRAMLGEDAVWTFEAQLLAALIDEIRVGNWQRQGKRNAPKPKPIPRPGVRQESTTYGKDPIPISRFDDWWNQQRE
ncbi:hypothetical protein [Mobiluncus porci]|uniref:Uncharacterized protein n=1 Tax=Mobiluncus porci TaxID=2652278 RepID=A0A7K0K553_9ACTO|nr:hypothetical protein [Mobiluncus porci]MST50569.1 hypothetical protein [Mobiluncus porci]